MNIREQTDALTRALRVAGSGVCGECRTSMNMREQADALTRALRVAGSGVSSTTDHSEEDATCVADHRSSWVSM